MDPFTEANPQYDPLDNNELAFTFHATIIDNDYLLGSILEGIPWPIQKFVSIS